jgi:serine/threonine protein kinase
MIHSGEISMRDLIPENVSPDEARRDEALAVRLEQYLESGQVPQGALPPAGPELESLRPVVESLRGLCVYLQEAGADDISTQPPGPYPDTVCGPQRRVGKYEVVRALGEGGQAAALLAFDPDLRRHVVLKCYHTTHGTAEQEAVLKEGQALVRVRSPDVAQCYSAERAEGIPFLVMEYISGKSLAERQRDRPCDIDTAMQLIGRLAEGLAAVHACGLLHRDIKPANIVVGDDGLPRLVDFGLASVLAGEELRRVSGTLPYMAPEQARGESERIDARTDVYGLGAVLYELLTDRPPHEGTDRAALWRAVREGRVPPAIERNPRVPRMVSDLCQRCLATDHAQRFRSAAELAEAIRRVEGRRRWRRRLTWKTALIAVAVTMVLAGVVVGLTRLVGRNDPTHSEHNDGQQEAQVTHRESPAPSPVTEDLDVRIVALGGRHDDEGRLLLTLGEHVVFQVIPSRTAFLALWCMDDDGNVTQLFPNKWEKDHLVKGGEARLVPGLRQYAIRAKSVSKGPEKVIVFASTKRWEPPTREHHRGSGPEQGYVVFGTPGERQEFDDLLRSLELVTTTPGANDPPPANAKVMLPYLVRPAE